MYSMQKKLAMVGFKRQSLARFPSDWSPRVQKNFVLDDAF